MPTAAAAVSVGYQLQFDEHQLCRTLVQRSEKLALRMKSVIYQLHTYVTCSFEEGPLDVQTLLSECSLAPSSYSTESGHLSMDIGRPVQLEHELRAENSNQVCSRRPTPSPCFSAKLQLKLEVSMYQLQRAFSLAAMEKNDLLLLLQY